MLLLREIPSKDRPRERLKNLGAQALLDHELIAILIGSGTKERDVMKIAADLLPVIDERWTRLTTEDIETVSGIGSVKAALIMAALEFARRRIRPNGIRITCAADVLPLISHLSDRKQEHFVCISLNGAHEVIATRVITIGLVNSTQIHPREVFCEPIVDRACAVIVAHNHPSGNIVPSDEDRRVTKVLVEAGKVLGIKVLDHIIFAGREIYSFADRGDI